MSSLSIQLLGQLTVSWGERLLTSFRSNRVPALLAYLAVEADRPHRREALIELLWPGLLPASGRQNLRQTLYLLRGDIPQLPAKGDNRLVPLLLSDRHTVQLNPDGDFFLDVARLELSAGRQGSLGKLTEAVDLYQGDFLAGFYLPDSENFEEWVGARRAMYRRLVLEGLGKLTAVLLSQNDFPTAERYARRQLEIDNLRESSHRQLMELLAKKGQRRAALSHYETFVACLRAELDVEPTAATRQLAESIRAGTFDQNITVSLPSLLPSNLPMFAATPFVGRETELAELVAYLADPEVRLLTLLGIGGVGKTRLAMALAERQQAVIGSMFSDGVYFVPLSSLQEENQMVLALADALKLSPQAQNGRLPKQQLLDFLRSKQMLLILDNFEHLLAHTGLVIEVLQTAAKVKIVVTSRERLHLQAGQVYLLHGLGYPEATALPESPQMAKDYDAMQLFLQAARRNRANFGLYSGSDSICLAQICRLVAGLPLALELAASWVDILSLADMVAELQQGFDLLERDMQDLPPRQRSMRATIDYSWQRLTEKEQDIFARLSVFRGGFTREAAQVVAGASLQYLTGLVHKSLVQVEENGRYQLHELLRQYGASKLGEMEGEETAVRNQHSRYFCHLLGKKDETLRSARFKALKEIEADLDNIEDAWHWAVQYRLLGYLDSVGYALFWYYQERMYFHRSLALYQWTAEQLAPTGFLEVVDKDTARLLGRVFICLANTYYHFSQFDKAENYLQKSQMLWESNALAQTDTRRDEAFLFYIKAITIRLENSQASVKLGQKSLQLARASGDQWQEARTLRQLGFVYESRSNYEMAQESFGKALVLFRLLGDQFSLSRLLLDIGFLARSMSDYQRSEALFKESLALARSQENNWAIADALTSLSYLQQFLGNFESGVHYLRQAIALHQQNHDDYRLAFDTVILAVAELFLGCHSQARHELTQSLQIAEVVTSVLDSVLLHQSRAYVWMGKYEVAQLLVEKARANLAVLKDSDVNFNHWSFDILGSVALAQADFVSASKNLSYALNRRRTYYGSNEAKEWYTLYQVMLSRAEWGLGRYLAARQQMFEALTVTVKIRAFIPLLHVLSILPVLLAGEAELRHKIRAVEIYALATTHPFVADCSFFSDIAGKEIKQVENLLPPNVVAEANAHGQGLDFWATAENLLQEIIELGWGNDFDE